MYMLLMENGQEFPAVIVEEETQFTATANDIRKDTVAATAAGVTVGTKVIPSYYTTEGYKIVPAGGKFSISLLTLNRHNFTKLQALICPYNGSIAASVAVETVAIDYGVYAVNSTEQIETVTKNDNTKSIDLGLTNTTETMYVIRYFTFREDV